MNEQLAAEAFTRQSAVFDELYSKNAIVEYKRWRVRNHITQYLSPASKLLELNAGTGHDALYFASQSHRVHATDISDGMLDALAARIQKSGLEERISFEQCSFTELEKLQNRGPFDAIFSNLAGLNCTDRLDIVLDSCHSLLTPGGTITMVLLPPFCLWETLMFFRGHFKTAFRRFNAANGRTAHVEGVYFKCWYYSPSYVAGIAKNKFDVVNIEGLCSIVPPSYLEGFPGRFPKLFKQLQVMEKRFANKWPWKNIGDYYIITLRKK